MKKTIYILFFNLIAAGLFAQSPDTTWKNFKEIETPYYHLLVPYNWLDLGSVGELVEHSFDATSMYFPDSFNAAPILVGLFVINQPASNLEEAKQRCLNGYKTNSDRVFPENFVEGQQKIKLASGQDAYILNTRFFRKTKNLNQSRFDLVVYSDKAKQSYLVTISVQYNDSTYKFEEKFHLADFAKRAYSYFILK
jgi:hypothetical protein